MLIPEFGKRVRKVLLERTASQVMFLLGKTRTLKGPSMTSSRSCSRGRIRMTFSMCWRLTVIRTFLRAICCRFFTEGQKSEGRRMAGNAEVMDLWAKFSSEGMTKVAAEEHLMMAQERI